MHPGGGLHHDHGHRTDARPPFRERVDELVAHHPVVERNRYTAWFAGGAATRGEVRHLTVQFSVFSHLFVEAQLRKVINAADLDTYRAGKEILLNELGVVFNAGVAPRRRAPTRIWWPPRAPSTAAGSASAPPTSSGCSGSRRPLGLGFDDLGKRRHGTPIDAVLLRRAPRGLRRRGRVGGRGRELRRRALGGRRVLEGAHRRASRRSRRASASACRSRSGPGTTRWRTSTPPTPPTSWWRRTRSRGSTRSGSAQGASRMLDGVQVFWDGLWADHEAGVER